MNEDAIMNLTRNAECEVINNTARLVSYQGNSRKTYHIPPRSSIITNEIEVRNLSMIKKLVARGVIALKIVDIPGKSKSAFRAGTESTTEAAAKTPTEKNISAPAPKSRAKKK